MHLMVFAIGLLFILGLMPPIRAQDPTLEQQALNYITNILPLDFSNYQLSEPKTDTFNNTSDIFIFYDLASDSRKLHAVVQFTAGKFVELDLRPISGHPSTGVYENRTLAAIHALEGFGKTNQLDASPFTKTFSALGSSRNVTYGNLTLTQGVFSIPNTVNSTIYHWSYTWNGLEYAGLNLEFNYGLFYRLRSSLDHALGNTDVKISQDQAEKIAANYLLTNVFSKPKNNDTIIFANNITLDSSRMTLSSQNSNVYVPCWLMLYDQSSLCLSVNVLAASGQASAQMLGTPLSIVGVNPNPVEWNENQATIHQSTTTPSAVSQPTSSQQTNSTSNLPSNTSNQQANSQLISTSNFFVIAGALILAIIVITCIFSVQRYRKQV